MNPIPKQDLRFVKNENLIRKTFREMMAETEYSKISIKELTERAQINRKTFYLHYPSLDHLLTALQTELMSPTLRMISETVFPDDVEKIIQHSFQFMAALDPVDKKILSSKGNIPDEKSPSDLIREHFFIKYDRFPEYNRFESNLIITYFSVCLGVIYRAVGSRRSVHSSRENGPPCDPADPAWPGRSRPDEERRRRQRHIPGNRRPLNVQKQGEIHMQYISHYQSPLGDILLAADEPA